MEGRDGGQSTSQGEGSRGVSKGRIAGSSIHYEFISDRIPLGFDVIIVTSQRVNKIRLFMKVVRFVFVCLFVLIRCFVLIEFFV